LTVMARPWTPWKLHVEAPGKHELKIGGNNADEGAWNFIGTVKTLVADVVLGDVWPEKLNLHIKDLDMDGSALLMVSSLRIGFHHDPSARASEIGVNVSVQGQNITVPGGLPEPLGNQVDVIDVMARITGDVRPGPAQDRVPAWQQSGGAVRVERLKFRGGPLAFTAGGRAALDKDLQPQGAFTAKIEGLFQVMEILRAKGLMRDGDAVMATMALSALSKRPKDGGTPFINISVTVQDGDVGVGPLKVMTMPTLDWGFPVHAPEPAPVMEPTPPPRDYKDVKPIY